MMDFDVMVVGGGPAGIAAACTAAECGAKTLLLERFGRLGGMAVQALVGPLMGHVESRIVNELLERLGGRTVDFLRMDLELYEYLSEKGVEILLHSPVVDVLGGGDRIYGVAAACREGRREFTARCIIDATGDGDVALRAGIPFEIGRDGDRLTQPMSIMYTIAGIEPAQRFKCDSEEDARNFRVNGRFWEEIVQDARNAGRLPENVGVVRLYHGRRPGESVVNAVQVNRLNGCSSADLTRAEIEGRRQAFVILDFLRETLPGYREVYLSAMPAVIGVRETRRFEGVARLEKKDCLEGRRFPDAVVRQANFSIDIHNPDGCGQAAGHDRYAAGVAEYVKPYDIPYGVLLPRRIDGILFAGRCISASHEALASCRVMCIAMALGAGAGAAAAYAAKHGCELRDVPVHELHRVLFEND